MEIDKALDDFFKVWRLIYNTSENKIDEVWEADTLQNLIEEFNEEENKIHRNITENVDMDMSKKEKIVPMKTTEIKDEDLKEKLKNLKNNKAAAIVKLKRELFKELGKREGCREIMGKCFNKILEGEETPESWNLSRKKMIKKKGKNQQ